MRIVQLATLLALFVIATACQEETPQPIQPAPASVQSGSAEPKTALPAAEENKTTVETSGQPATSEQPEQEPPRPPVLENFQGAPQLSLFPRVADFRPADDSDRLPYWNTFIDHLVKVTGVAEEQTTGNRAWVFRSIDSIDSVGYFSPLAVEPNATYRVSFTLATELAAGASAGIGILEFNEFLWIPNQYTEEIFKQHFRASQEGKRLTGTNKGKQTFTFTTGPDTRMIHLVLFREGTHDRNNVMFDDIKIDELSAEKEKAKS